MTFARIIAKYAAPLGSSNLVGKHYTWVEIADIEKGASKQNAVLIIAVKRFIL